MTPLVSCICVTQNRRFFLKQAVVQWRSAARGAFGFQDYQDKCELIIVDGSEVPNAWAKNWITATGEPVIYAHVPSPAHTRTGWFHNEAVRLARGRYILVWDDDDAYAPDRITKQVAALEAHPEGAIAFTSQFYWYHLPTRVGARAMTWDVGHGTMGASMAFHKSVWERGSYRDVDQGEDSHFWSDHEQLQTTFVDQRDPSLFVYLRHGANGSHFGQKVTFETGIGQEARGVLSAYGVLSFYDELSELLHQDPWNELRHNTRQLSALSAMHAAMRRNMGNR